MLSEHKLEVLRVVEATALPVWKVLDQLEIPPAQPTIGGDTSFERGGWQDSGNAPRDPDGSGIKSCPKNGTGSWKRPFCFQTGRHGK